MIHLGSITIACITAGQLTPHKPTKTFRTVYCNIVTSKDFFEWTFITLTRTSAVVDVTFFICVPLTWHQYFSFLISRQNKIEIKLFCCLFCFLTFDLDGCSVFLFWRYTRSTWAAVVVEQKGQSILRKVTELWFALNAFTKECTLSSRVENCCIQTRTFTFAGE